MLDKLTEIEKRYEQLNQQLADPEIVKNPSKYQKLAREVGSLRETVEVASRYRQCIARQQEAEQIISESDPDEAELVELARDELAQGQREAEQLEAELRVLLIPRDPDDSRNAVVEVRAGTGGDEAGLFATDLYRMYSRFAERHSWKVETLSTSINPSGGFKEVVFMVTGSSAFGQLKYESGVHRVQRVPKTEASGRIHTSAASVAVLPEAEEVDVEILPEDLDIDVFRSGGPGGSEREHHGLGGAHHAQAIRPRRLLSG